MTWNAFGSGFGMAWDSIRQGKMRAFLTVLGVVIGTSCIIGVGSILAGLDGAIADIFKSFGPDTIIVLKFNGGFRTGDLTPEERRRQPLTLEQARAIRERCPTVEHVSPYLFADFHRIVKARYKTKEVFQLELAGTESGYAAGGTEMLYGRFLSDAENFRRAPVVVLGEDIAKALMPYMDPVGKWIEVDGRHLEVIGVMKRPAASFPGQDDRRVLLPYFTMKKVFPSLRENMFIVIASKGRIPQAMDEVRMVLRQERRVKGSAPDNFWMTTAEQMIEQFRKITAMTFLVMIVLSSVGLLVGGIGVMNIMLVSVTERTKEIGVRKAIGARRADIVIQFLSEAATLTLAGGMLGLLVGYLISLAARLAFPTMPTAVPLWAAMSGVIMSLAVGLFFGIWPANKAARLDPVEALRYE
ncbi:MAG: ABC transporter permease [Candidatus Solibacter usitatus]|nr:ABC transporter permease [Candidatus Solibacter usitatus]